MLIITFLIVFNIFSVNYKLATELSPCNKEPSKFFKKEVALTRNSQF